MMQFKVSGNNQVPRQGCTCSGTNDLSWVRGCFNNSQQPVPSAGCTSVATVDSPPPPPPPPLPPVQGAEYTRQLGVCYHGRESEISCLNR